MLITTATLLLALGQHPSMPAGMTHEQHVEQMRRDAETMARGKVAMGFDQDATTHHFQLEPDGGTISVEVKDPRDTVGRDQIRAHLREIAADFARGAFDKPFATHAEVPPGVPALQRLKDRVAYTYENTERGGRVRIRTSHDEARAAIHEFLRYQIREHHTGDTMTIRK